MEPPPWTLLLVNTVHRAVPSLYPQICSTTFSFIIFLCISRAMHIVHVYCYNGLFLLPLPQGVGCTWILPANIRLRIFVVDGEGAVGRGVQAGRLQQVSNELILFLSWSEEESIPPCSGPSCCAPRATSWATLSSGTWPTAAGVAVEERAPSCRGRSSTRRRCWKCVDDDWVREKGFFEKDIF